MPRFFIDNTAVNGGYAVINGSDARHISLALRMRVGDGITLCDFSRNEYTCIIDSITPLEVRAKIQSCTSNSTEPPYSAHLFQALPKGDRADTIVQKSVECGISEIVFFESERCIAKLKEENAKKKLMRFKNIALERLSNAEEESFRKYLLPRISGCRRGNAWRRALFCML